MPEVSVVIPVYNGERYVKDAINSVLNQTFKDTEIIVVNDASTDNSERVIYNNFRNLIEKNKIKYFKNNENRGRNITANFGAKKAKGKYIFFLDSDDLWKKKHIETVLDKFEDADIIYTKPKTFIDEYGNIKRISKSGIENDLDKLIFSSRVGFPSATAFKKLSFPYYNPDFKFREDIELFIRAKLEGKKIKIIDTDTVLIREHNAPTRMSKTYHFYDYTIKLYEFYKDKIPAKYKGYFLFHIGDIALKYGDILKGWKLILTALKISPNLLSDKRVMLSILKRGFRIDRYFAYKNFQKAFKIENQ